MRQKVWPLRGRPESRRSEENVKSLKKTDSSAHLSIWKWDFVEFQAGSKVFRQGDETDCPIAISICRTIPLLVPDSIEAVIVRAVGHCAVKWLAVFVPSM